MAETKLYFGGIPTAPDVKRLLEAFPPGDWAAGALIAYEEAEDVIGSKRGTSRFVTVTNAWRKTLRRVHGVHVVSVRGMGFQRLSEIDRVTNGAKVMGEGVKKIGRGVRLVGEAKTERMSDTERATATHLRRLGEAMFEAARESGKQIAAAITPAKQLPRSAPEA